MEAIIKPILKDKATILKKDIKEYVILLAEKSAIEAEIYPIDRSFLEPRINEILSFNRLDFIYYNFELYAGLYANQILVCLPELWKDINYDDLMKICNRFNNVEAFYSLIRFTYKYAEIDIIEGVLNVEKVKATETYFRQILEFLLRQWNVLLKSKNDLEDFEDGFIDVDYNEWIYIKQRFLLDKRVKPALLNQNELKIYILDLIRKYE